MQLTKFTDYSLRVMMYVGRQEEGSLSTISEITAAYDLSRNHVVKIVHRLSKLGYVVTIRGKGGGIRVGEGALKVSLREFVEQIEPHFEIVECFAFGGSTCRLEHNCRLKSILFGARQAFLSHLGKFCLADLVEGDFGLFS